MRPQIYKMSKKNPDQLLDESMLQFLERPGSKSLPMIFAEGSEDSYYVNEESLPEDLPIVPTRNIVAFPYVTIPILVGRSKTKRVITYLENCDNKHVLLFPQRNDEIDSPNEKDLIKIGVLGEVVKIIEVEEGLLSMIVIGKRKVELKEVTADEPFLRGTYLILEENIPAPNDVEFSAMITEIRNLQKELIGFAQGEDGITSSIRRSLDNLKNPLSVVNFACLHCPESLAVKQSWMYMNDIKTRAYAVLTRMGMMNKLIELKEQILRKTRNKLDQQQRDYFLQQQLRTIREELNEDSEDTEIEKLEERASKKKWSKEIADIFAKELTKLERMSVQSPDYSIQLQYLQTMLDLPWNEFSEDKLDLKHAASVLDKDHFGLEKVKERILEHLAVLKLKGDMKAPIICLYGPPGVGKTSLGKSVAKALNREYVRISLGGLHDEAEIRGHRRTYIGAMPGRIVKGFLKAKKNNPVFVLDEIDKITKDLRGDPSSALLEVLDPEQNNTFHDNYLDVDYDLSHVLFIATANDVSSIPGPLRDRMELIDVSGYILEEKVEIAFRHLRPKIIKNHGLTLQQVKIGKATLKKLIEDYTKESGVRNLEQKLAGVVRKIAKKIAEAPEGENVTHEVRPNDLAELLGPPIFTKDQYEGNEYAGVVTGLAWTSVGGEILLIESAISPSKSGKMSITGNLGDVMKESAVLALEYIKSHCKEYDIPSEVFDHWNVHIHVPEGAIPKDGPSAGITLVTSLVSTFTQRKVRASIAMTGEITLRGKVLPVGGIKEKILAAKRSGIKTIILSKENERDIQKINDIYLKGLKFIFVSDIKEVIETALTTQKVYNPVNLMETVKKAQAQRTRSQA